MWDLPGPGLEPIPLHCQVDCQPLCHQGSPVCGNLSSPTWDLSPRPGIERTSPVVEASSLNFWTARGVPELPSPNSNCLLPHLHLHILKAFRLNIQKTKLLIFFATLILFHTLSISSAAIHTSTHASQKPELQA